MYHDDNEGNAVEWLKDMGLIRNWWVHPFMTGVLHASLVIAILFMVFKSYISSSGFDAVPLVIAVATILIAYNEWRSCRYENSIEKFYDRLAESNTRLMDRSVTKLIFDDMDLHESKAIMYVYGELDNLDYVIQKYRNWLMSAQQARRGLATFQERVGKQNFWNYVGTPCKNNLGYSDILWEVVNNLRREAVRTFDKCITFSGPYRKD